MWCASSKARNERYVSVPNIPKREVEQAIEAVGEFLKLARKT